MAARAVKLTATGLDENAQPGTGHQFYTARLQPARQPQHERHGCERHALGGSTRSGIRGNAQHGGGSANGIRCEHHGRRPDAVSGRSDTAAAGDVVDATAAGTSSDKQSQVSELTNGGELPRAGELTSSGELPRHGEMTSGVKLPHGEERAS